MAPHSAPKITRASMMAGSTMPLPTVAATCRPKNRKAMKLKNAAQITAICGLIAPVETIVAMELAASWKPFMKSKARATTTRKTSASMLMPGPSRVLEHDRFDDVGDVLRAIGDRFQQLVDLLHLEQVLDVGLFAEQLGHGAAHDLVGVALELVDLLAQRQDRV